MPSKVFVHPKSKRPGIRRRGRYKGSKNHGLPLAAPFQQRFFNSQKEMGCANQKFYSKSAMEEHILRRVFGTKVESISVISVKMPQE